MRSGRGARNTRSRGRTRRAPAMAAMLGSLAGIGACVPGAPDGGTGDPTGPGAAGSVRLAWDAPSTDADGGPLSDLAGFRVRFAPGSDPDGPGADSVDVGSEATALVTNLAPGTWTFAVVAVDTAGNESAPSAPLTVRVGEP